MHVLVAVKQVPAPEAVRLGAGGRVAREGVALEMSAYCRRALAKGIELASSTGGCCTVVSLGPPSAERVLREALACGADEAVLLCDEAFAGSDTLATARALAALAMCQAPVDLFLLGKASLDAETGQVGPQLAELLDLPFAGAVRSLELDVIARQAHVVCEHDDGGCELKVTLPAVLAMAERSCRPAKAGHSAVDAVARDRVVRMGPGDLGAAGPWGTAGSPTRVGSVTTVATERNAVMCSGAVAAQVRQALGLLAERGALAGALPGEDLESREEVRAPTVRVADGPVVAVLVEPGRDRFAHEMLATAANLAGACGGSVTAVVCKAGQAHGLWPAGVDAVLQVEGAEAEEDVARAVSSWAAEVGPEAVLAPATPWGREIAARVAACIGAGLVADARDLEIRACRLWCSKPAGGEGALASIFFTSPVQMATVRPGALAPPAPQRSSGQPVTRSVRVSPRGRVEVLARWRDDDMEDIERAGVVIGLGLGVPPHHYDEVRLLAGALGAELGATRKVTDLGLLPRSRQIGVTGRSVAPRLYLALGISGSTNHLAGARRAGTIVAVNNDPRAPIFASCDIGILGDWREVADVLRAELADRSLGVIA